MEQPMSGGGAGVALVRLQGRLGTIFLSRRCSRRTPQDRCLRMARWTSARRCDLHLGGRVMDLGAGRRCEWQKCCSPLAVRGEGIGTQGRRKAGGAPHSSSMAGGGFQWNEEMPVHVVRVQAPPPLRLLVAPVADAVHAARTADPEPLGPRGAVPPAALTRHRAERRPRERLWYRRVALCTAQPRSVGPPGRGGDPARGSGDRGSLRPPGAHGRGYSHGRPAPPPPSLPRPPWVWQRDRRFWRRVREGCVGA